MNKSVKNLLFIGAAVWLFLCIIAVIKKANEYSIGDSAVILGMGILPFVFVIFAKILLEFENKRMEKQINAKIEKENMRINALQAGIPVLNIPSLYLGNSQLHYYEPAILLWTENKMMGFINKSSSSTWEHTSLINFINEDFHQYKSVSTGSSQAVYENITNRYGGKLALSGKSIIFINQEKGFELKIDEVAFIQQYADGISIQSGNDVHLVLIDEPRFFLTLLNMIKDNANT